MKKLSKDEGLFALLKWLSTIDYLDQTDDERFEIRNLIGPSSKDLLKIFLLGNVTRLPIVYLDGVYLSGLLRNSEVLLLPAVCDLLVSANDRGDLFESLMNFVVSRLAFKPLVISFVTKGVFNKRATSGLAEIENLKSLYTHVRDEELKKCMASAVTRIMQYGLACDEEFAKAHREIDRYNECFLFESLNDGAQYDYLELIPEGRLRNHIRPDLDEFRTILDDFAEKAILPNINLLYDSGKKEIRLEYITDQSYQLVNSNEFSLEPESIIRACLLVADIYLKACYFRRFTGKIPHISINNLLISSVKNSVIFRTVGQSLCTVHILAGITVGDEEADIAWMLSRLISSLLFKSESEEMEFLKKTTHHGVHAFLFLFIKNMGAKDPRFRFSSLRFEYLVNHLKHTSELVGTQFGLEVLYLRERLKGALYLFNSESITWHGLCRALNEHISIHIRAVFNPDELRAFSFRPRVFFSDRGKRQLHRVSRHLLELALCREDLTDIENNNPAYLDLVELLLLYSLICLEIISLGRTLASIRALKTLASSSLLTGQRIRIRAGDYEMEVAAGDLAALVILQPSEKKDENVIELTLRQLALQALLTNNFEIDDGISVHQPEALTNEVFRIFAHACLERIPSVEFAIEDQIQSILFALQSHEDIPRLEGLEEMRNAVTILAQDLRRIRSELRLFRKRGRADGRYFPPDVRYRRWGRGSRHVKEDALLSCALTNSFPSSREGYPSSWDLNGNLVKNFIIPSEGLNSLIQDLKSGKLFGFKFSYLYSGKAMIIWDVVAFVVNSLCLVICDQLKESTTNSNVVKGICSVLVIIFAGLVLTLFGKIIINDLGHWIPRHRIFIKYILKKFSGENGSSESTT